MDLNSDALRLCHVLPTRQLRSRTRAQANNMKTITIITSLLVVVGTASAIFVNPFKSWNDLTESSRDIVIARCTSTLGTTKPEKTTAIIDGMIPSDIEVLYVLKGSTKPGLSRMVSQYWPYQGEQFLMFAGYSNDQYFTGYSAVEGYRVVPLSRHFNQYIWDHQLAGKPLQGQVQWILKSRLEDLNAEIAQDKDEKTTIEVCMTNNGEMNLSNSVPPPTPIPRPLKGGVTF